MSVLSLENSRGLDYYSIMKMVDSCVELSEVNFGGTMMSGTDRINYIVNKLTPKVEKLSLEDIDISDENLSVLAFRCGKIKELNLRGTVIGERAVDILVEELGDTLIKLSLPDDFNHFDGQEVEKLMVWNGGNVECDGNICTFENVSYNGCRFLSVSHWSKSPYTCPKKALNFLMP